MHTPCPPELADLVHLMGIIYDYESLIDRDRDLVLLTWSLDPSKIRFKGDPCRSNMWYVRRFLSKLGSCCDNYIVLPELSLDGRLHYHGWVQITRKGYFSGNVIPYLKRFGFVKLNIARDYKINDYEKEGNALHYYKKDLSEIPEWCTKVSMYDAVCHPDNRHMDFDDKCPRGQALYSIIGSFDYEQVKKDREAQWEENIKLILNID